MSEKHKRHATGRTTVKTYEPKVFDEVPGGPSLKDIHVAETFSGDIEGDGVAHVVRAAPPDGSASFVGIERVRGNIAGKKGSFLLQVRGTVVGKEMGAGWSSSRDPAPGGCKACEAMVDSRPSSVNMEPSGSTATSRQPLDRLHHRGA